jgi:zinc/manganese transport system ATP-binding protein
MAHNTSMPVVELSNATLRFGKRTLWANLTATVRAGEFVAVLGPNGTGKTTLLKAILGLEQLAGGTIRVNGTSPGEGNSRVGYIPQQKSFDRFLPIRGRDLVELGLNGNRYGWHNHAAAADRVTSAIKRVHAQSYADMPIGTLSGGEQQRLRIAQAIVGTPSLLLCDEPLLSLDLPSQSLITRLLHEYRTHSNAAIIFVTHEINPILPYVDKVLYIANGKWALDTPERVLRTDTLTSLYGSPVEVLRHQGRLLVIGADEAARNGQGTHHEEHA